MSEPMEREPMELVCRECGRVIVLEAAEQEKIIAQLKLPAARKIVECECHSQIALAARPIRQGKDRK